MFSLIMHADACDSLVSFSVHCPAGCAKADYTVYGTTEYRGVSQPVVSSVSKATVQVGCFFVFFLENRMSKYLPARPPLSGLKHLCCSYPRWSGTE